MARQIREGYGPGNPEFVGIERRTINNCKEWDDLSGPSKIFYIHLKAHFNGSNNGKIKLSYSSMKSVRGCSSKTAISKAIKELEEKGWIERTKRGGMFRFDNFFLLTFRHDCFRGKSKRRHK